MKLKVIRIFLLFSAVHVNLAALASGLPNEIRISGQGKFRQVADSNGNLFEYQCAGCSFDLNLKLISSARKIYEGTASLRPLAGDPNQNENRIFRATLIDGTTREGVKSLQIRFYNSSSIYELFPGSDFLREVRSAVLFRFEGNTYIPIEQLRGQQVASYGQYFILNPDNIITEQYFQKITSGALAIQVH